MAVVYAGDGAVAERGECAARPPEALKQIGEEVSEQLDWKPSQFIRRLGIRRKYVRRPGTPAPVEGPPVLISEYEGQLPLCRQEKPYWDSTG